MNCFKWFIWILSPIKFSKNLGLPMCQYNASISESRRLGPLCKEDFPMVRDVQDLIKRAWQND